MLQSTKTVRQLVPALGRVFFSQPSEGADHSGFDIDHEGSYTQAVPGNRRAPQFKPASIGNSNASTLLMDAEAGSLLLLDESMNELYFEVAHGEKGAAVREIRLKLGEGIAGYVAQTGEPVIVNDVQRDSRFFLKH